MKVANLKEVCQTVKGFEDYVVSNLGYVKSLPRYVGSGKARRLTKERVLKPVKNGKGYLNVALCFNGLQKRELLHRLVALAFVPNPNPELYNEVNHKDGDKLNCRADNLEWTDRLGNMRHAVDTGLMDFKGEKHPRWKHR